MSVYQPVYLLLGNLNLKEDGVEKGNGMAGATLHWGPQYYYNEYMRTAAERYVQ